MFNSEPPAVVSLKEGLCCLLIRDAKIGDALLLYGTGKTMRVFFFQFLKVISCSNTRKSDTQVFPHLILDKDFRSLSFL